MAIARPIHRRLFVVFDRAHGRLSRGARALLKDAGVSPSQATALVYLGYHNGCQLSELANGTGVNNAAATGLVTRMERAGLVERKAMASDGRAKTVHLTGKGLGVRIDVMDALRSLDERLSKQFTGAELDTVYKFLTIAADLESN